MKGHMIVRGPYKTTKALLMILDNLPDSEITNMSTNINEDTLQCRVDIFFEDYDVMVQCSEQMGYTEEPTILDNGISLSIEKW